MYAGANWEAIDNVPIGAENDVCNNVQPFFH